MNDLAKHLGKKIKLARVENDMTQSQLGMQTNIDSSHIGRIERGEVNITVETLYRIANAVERTPGDLLPVIEVN